MNEGRKEKLPIQIIELSPDDWRLFRDLKLHSLEEEPIAFEDSEEGKEKYLQRSESEWKGILSGKMSGGRAGESLQIFAKSGQEIVGMASAIIPSAEQEKTATIQHVYVDRTYRGQNIGKELLQNLIEKLKSRGDLQKVKLQVVVTQLPAIELYKSLGFVEVGRREAGAERDGHVYDELEMVLNERAEIEQFETITTENFEAASKRLGKLNWDGKHQEALPLADKIFKFRSGQGERDAALIQYASNYYSAASRLWKDGGMKAAVDVGKNMNTALRALQERIEKEMEKQGGRRAGMVPVSLGRMTSSELDVMQAVYKRAAEIADHIPLVKPLRGFLVAKEKDPVRDFDAAALLAIRAGLKKVREERSAGKAVPPHTEIFLYAGSFDIAKRYGWEKNAVSSAAKIFELAKSYPWPPENISSEDVLRRLSEYGQAARVARHLRDVARKIEDIAKVQEFGRKAEAYVAHIPDQKAKL